MPGPERLAAARLVERSGRHQELRDRDVRSRRRQRHRRRSLGRLRDSADQDLARGRRGEREPEGLGRRQDGIGNDHYFGPCGPSGHTLHHYVITVIATPLEPDALKPGLTRDELLTALRGKSLAPASIVGRYTRPTP